MKNLMRQEITVEMTHQFDVIVVGAGAAGLMCAAKAAELSADVLLIERNERAGRKIMITGKGRCNVTNDCDAQEIIKNTKTNGRFLYSSVYSFTPYDTMELFESLGVKLKTERGNRVFPVSDKAVDIVDALVKYTKQNHVKTCNARIKKLIVEDGVLKGVEDYDGRRYYADKVVIATGGVSYPGTGSTGDGYTLAKSVGHTIIQPQPSLIPIIAEEDYCAKMMGLSLKNVTVTLWDKKKNKKIFSEIGEMLFTHFGVSGPLILSASSHMDAKRISDYEIIIDMKPALSSEQLDARILRDFSKQLNRDFINSLSELLPSKMIPVIVSLSGIEPDRKVNQIKKEERAALVNAIKNIKVTPKGFRPVKEAIITSGGVCVKEINPKTMESKLLPGLYFAGEVIDVDAYTGGFNLQIAFSTAQCAARAVCGIYE